MKTFRCECGNRLFWGSTCCVSCRLETGFCPLCQDIVALNGSTGNGFTCSKCKQALRKCRHYLEDEACNWCIAVDDESDRTNLCGSCQLTTVIPDISLPDDRTKWIRLEAAKRRVLYSLYFLKLPIGTKDNEWHPKLTFEFKADSEQPVSTGHAQGAITINIKEADSAIREQTRQEFGEPHRTLVGHFRHELGHYYWEVLIKGQREEEFQRLFGDPNLSYADAKKTYYNSPPPSDWSQHFISAYATMHPWEDFAETFGAYLDLVAILDTVASLKWAEVDWTDFEKLIRQYKSIGVSVNEFNREMGLKDLVPEVFSRPVEEKLKYVHNLLASGEATDVPATGTD